MSNPSSGAALEAGDEEIIPEDKQKPAETVHAKDMAYANGSPNKHVTTSTIPEESEPLSPGVHLPHQPAHHSPLSKDTSISLNELRAPLGTVMGAPLTTADSTVATPGAGSGEMTAGTPAVYDVSFPFPNFRPLPSSTNSPSPQQGMTIPPATSAPMSRNASAMSVTPAQPAQTPHHDNGPPPAPSSGAGARSGRSGSQSKPAMLGAIGEKKSFFQKMFHHEGKHDKEKLMLDIPKGGSGFSSGVNSPHPRDGTDSPPRTPGTPMVGSDSDHSRPPSRAPSVNGRKERGSDDVHAQPPVDRRAGTPPINGKPSITRRLSERSNDDKVVPAVVGPNGTAVVKEENVVASGNKFTLKDLLGRGEAGKLNRKPSQAGSDRGSTKGSERDYGDNQSTASLLKKYGVCEKAAIGKGATAVVRLAHKWDRREEKLYAVKEFRKRRKNETEKEYVKKLTSEFCISSTLHHPNVVETVDLVQDEQHHWCEVMEYCPGGDLYAAIKKGGMSSQEVECSFKQLLNGISYLHSMGVAHRDIKPENLLLDGRGHVKITDFGVSDVFRMCWEKKTHLSKGLCGSEPYIAPELFDQKEYDARLVDVWAAAVVFYCMQFQELPWRVAKSSDPTFATYLTQYYPVSVPSPNPPAGGVTKESPANGIPSSTPAPLNNLIPRECRSVLKHMLDPDPKTRWGVDEVLKDKWVMGIEVCVEGQKNGHSHQGAGMEIVKIA